MGKPIFFVGGGKGGTGKSMFSMVLIDYLTQKGEDVFLVESDTANPDVWKIYKDTVSAEFLDLDTKKGWIELINFAEKYPSKNIVINSAARNGDGIKNSGKMLLSAMGELERDLTTFWVVNRQKDSLILLKKYMEVMEGNTHVVLNTHFGEEKKFALYHVSNTKTEIEASGGKTLLLDDLADEITDRIYTDRVPIQVAMTSWKLGERAELARWRTENKDMLVSASI